MYAQILKTNLEVGLIGGQNEGLPIVDDRVYCIDIGDRTDIKVGMLYNPDTQEFTETPIIPIIIIPLEQRNQAYLNMIYKEDGVTPLIIYKDKNITVEECRIELENYTFDTSAHADDIRHILTSQYNEAKKYIRSLYPD